MMKKKLTVLALAVSLILALSCCGHPRYAVSISALDSGGAEAGDFDIDVIAGAYPSICVLVSYAGPGEELEIYTGDPMVGVALYDGDGRPVGGSVINDVLAPYTLRKDELQKIGFNLSHMAENLGGSLSEGVYRLEVNLSYILSKESRDELTTIRSFALELTKAK